VTATVQGLPEEETASASVAAKPVPCLTGDPTVDDPELRSALRHQFEAGHTDTVPTWNRREGTKWTRNSSVMGGDVPISPGGHHSLLTAQMSRIERTFRCLAGCLAIVSAALAATVKAQTLPATRCQPTDRMARFVRGKLESIFSDTGAAATAIRARRGLEAVSRESIVQVSDTILCRRAMLAADSVRRRGDAAYSPEPLTARAVYLYQVGSYFVVYEPPELLGSASRDNPLRVFDGALTGVLASLK
jgi:hypothetical protein